MKIKPPTPGPGCFRPLNPRGPGAQRLHIPNSPARSKWNAASSPQFALSRGSLSSGSSTDGCPGAYTATLESSFPLLPHSHTP